MSCSVSQPLQGFAPSFSAHLPFPPMGRSPLTRQQILHPAVRVSSPMVSTVSRGKTCTRGIRIENGCSTAGQARCAEGAASPLSSRGEPLCEPLLLRQRISDEKVQPGFHARTHAPPLPFRPSRSLTALLASAVQAGLRAHMGDCPLKEASRSWREDRDRLLRARGRGAPWRTIPALVASHLAVHKS